MPCIFEVNGIHAMAQYRKTFGETVNIEDDLFQPVDLVDEEYVHLCLLNVPASMDMPLKLTLKSPSEVLLRRRFHR